MYSELEDMLSLIFCFSPRHSMTISNYIGIQYDHDSYPVMPVLSPYFYIGILL